MIMARLIRAKGTELRETGARSMSRRKTPSPDIPDELQGFDAFELRLGDVMRGERATIGKSLIDIQRELKIKATYIAAIENADPTAFDTPGFIAGYVRSYARYLQLDPEWAWESFCREAGFEQPHGMSSAASSPKPVRKTGLDALSDPNAAFVPQRESPFAEIEMRAVGSLAVLVTLICAVGYGAWSVLQEVQRVQLAPVESAPGVIADLGSGALVSDVVAPSQGAFGEGDMPGSAGDAMGRLYSPAELDIPIVDPRDGPIASMDSRHVGVLAEPTQPRPAFETPEVADASAEPEPPQVLAADVPGLYLIAVRPAWVRVSAADGTILFEKTLEPGENWQVPATEEPSYLRSGNSGAIYFMVEGQTYGPAGDSGRVISNIPLGAVSVTESFALADTAADPDLAVAVALLQATQ